MDMKLHPVIVVLIGVIVVAYSTLALNYVSSNGQCLTLGADHRSVALSPCGSSAYQQWDLSSMERLQLDQLCLDASGPQMAPCGTTQGQSWFFGGDGKITSRNMQGSCLGAMGGSLLVVNCLQASQFSVSPSPPLANQGLSQGLPQVSPQALPQMSQGGGLPQMMPPPPPVNINSQPAGQLDLSEGSKDHYLCVCLTDANDKSCNQAARSACLVGHLPSKLCRDSFKRSDHDKLSNEILALLENGRKCSQYDPNALRTSLTNEVSQEFSPEGTPTTKDHYLCVCLDLKQPEKCHFAVQAACLVGHIPAGDCKASLEGKDHDGASDHVLKLIDKGAGCPTQLALTKKQPEGESKTGFVGGLLSGLLGGKKESTGVTKRDRELCTCLDDFKSSECIKAITRACGKGRIPKEDCEASTKQYDGGVTRHVLRIIDHGAECPAHRSMTFTNHGCHCQQSWVGEDKKAVMSFPNNCGDPGGAKGFAWCMTYPTEHCAGVEGSTEWDRCDVPKYPKLHQQSVVNDEHYLCVCLSTTSTDEVCVAAVRSACEVGHLPSAECKASFEEENHDKVSDAILGLLRNGQRCSPTTLQGLIAGTTTIAAKAGEGVTTCPEGFFGFPNCRKKTECEEECSSSFGKTCDFDTGRCTCLPNFVGEDCSECAAGTSGRHCLPDAERLEESASYFQLALYAFFIYWACATFMGIPVSNVRGVFERLKQLGLHGVQKVRQRVQQRPQQSEQGSKPVMGGPRYAPVVSPEDEFEDDDDDDFEKPDLGTDVEEKRPAKKVYPKQSHTGMAV